MFGTVPDLLRLVAVPALGWAAWRDVKVRRVPNRLWYPLAALGALLLAFEGWQVFYGPTANAFAQQRFLRQTLLSLGLVVPAAYLIWRVGGWGGADAKALMTLAVLFPTTPTYVIPRAGPDLVLPWTSMTATVSTFSLSILTNTLVVTMAVPLVTAARNLLSRDLSVVMFVGTRVRSASVVDRHGSLMETPDGLTRRGLDIDALRMYLRWRQTDLSELRADPERYRDPASLPDDPGDPTDGAIADGGTVDTPDADAAGDEGGRPADHDDPWGAEAFLADVPHAWGTTPEGLRAGLEVLTSQDRVWYSPGIPFVVPMFVGLLVALSYGDLLVSLLIWLGAG